MERVLTIIDSFEVTKELEPRLEGLVLGTWYVLDGTFSSKEELPAQGSSIELQLPTGESPRAVVAGCEVRHGSGAVRLVDLGVRIPRLSKIRRLTEKLRANTARQ